MEDVGRDRSEIAHAQIVVQEHGRDLGRFEQVLEVGIGAAELRDAMESVNLSWERSESDSGIARLCYDVALEINAAARPDGVTDDFVAIAAEISLGALVTDAKRSAPAAAVRELQERGLLPDRDEFD